MVKRLQKRRAATTEQRHPRRETDRTRRSSAPSPEPPPHTENIRRGSSLKKEEEKAESELEEDTEAERNAASGTKQGEQPEKEMQPSRGRPNRSSQTLRVFCLDCMRDTHEGQRRTKQETASNSSRDSSSTCNNSPVTGIPCDKGHT